ncbi:unnamed protein product [Prunus armeniaca]
MPRVSVERVIYKITTFGKTLGTGVVPAEGSPMLQDSGPIYRPWEESPKFLYESSSDGDLILSSVIKVSFYHSVILQRVVLDPCPSALLCSEADTQELKGCHFEAYRFDAPPYKLEWLRIRSSLCICHFSSVVRDKISDSESPFEREPNAFDGESLNDQWDTNSEAVSLDAEGGEDTDVKIVSEGTSYVPTYGIRKGLMKRQPVPLAVVYSDGSHAGAN